MNGLLSMIGMQTELEYQMEDFPFRTPRIKFNTPKVIDLLIGRNVSQKCSMSSLSRVLRLWQLQEKML